MTQSSPAGVRLPGGSSAEESDQQRVHQLSSFQVRQMAGSLDRVEFGLRNGLSDARGQPDWHDLVFRSPNQ